MITTFTVVKSKALQSSLPLANAFVTVGLLPVPAGAPVKNPQTSTIVCSNSPSFNQLLNLWVHSGYAWIYLAPLASRQDQLELIEVVSCVHLKLKFMKTTEIVFGLKSLRNFFLQWATDVLVFLCKVKLACSFSTDYRLDLVICCSISVGYPPKSSWGDKN